MSMRKETIGNLKIFQEADKAMGKLLKKLDLVKNAGKNEIRGDRKFSTAIVCIFQFYTDLKTKKWKDLFDCLMICLFICLLIS